jgi:hypothetical protein
MVVMMAGSLIAVSALFGLPEAPAPGYTTAAMVSDTAPGTAVSTAKCKKKCRKRHTVSDSDLRDLGVDGVESVAALSTVLAVIALAAVL